MNKKIFTGMLLIAIIAVGGYFFPKVTVIREIKESLGSTGTRFPNGLSTNSTSPSAGQLLTTTLNVTSTSVLGTSGSTISGFNFGTCFLNFNNVPSAIAATTTVNVDCQATNMLATATAAQSALTGVTTGDNVSLVLATTTPTTNEGLYFLSANASSTPGYITAKFFNGTGASFTPGTTTAAGVQYRAFR